MNASRWRLIAILTQGRLPQVIGLIALLLISSALPLAGPQLLRVFIDNVVHGRPWSALVTIAGAFLVVSLADQLLGVVVGYVSTHVAWVATNTLREEVAHHALGLDLTFHESHPPGEMIERVDGDVSKIALFMSTFVVQVVGSTLTLVGALVVVFVEDWRIGAGMACFVALSAVAIARMRDFAVPRATERRAASAALFGEVEERLTGAEDLRANGGGAYAVRRFQAALATLISASWRASIATRTM